HREVISRNVAESAEAKEGAGAGTGTGAAGGGEFSGRPLCKQVSELLGRVTATTRSDPKVWDVYARFNEGARRGRERVLDCRVKQCRAIQSAPGWERDEAEVERLASASRSLTELYLEDGSLKSVYQAKMHLASAVRKVSMAGAGLGGANGCPGHEQLKALLERVEGVHAELKKGGV
ncbi:unnamed protein product, partial [Discosporangium mesarthrocarpum]